MATYVPAKYGVEYIFYVGLESVATAGAFQSNPTLASGDVTITKDGGSSANLTTLPTVTPASGKRVKVTVSATEMQADNVCIAFSDASGGEWKDLIINIQTAARQIDDLAYPTTSGRSIDVTTTGEVGIDWANIGSPTSTVTLSGTTVKTATDVETDTADIQSRIPAALVSGRIDSSVGAMAANVITATAINADAITDAKVASDVTIASVTGAVGSVTGNVGGNVVGSVASVTAPVTAGTVSDKTGYSLSSAGIQAIWDALTSALTTVSSIGKLFVDNINATISSRSSHTAANVRTEMDSNSTQLAKLGTPAGASVSADIAAIKAETASIQTDTNDLQTQVGTAGAGLTAVASAANLATLTGYVDTEVAAIKAKTDNLPASPANESTLSTVATNVAAILADTGTDGVVLSTAQMQALADIVLGRSVSNIDNTAATHSLYELIQAILESNTSTGSWVIYKTNGSTTFNTRTLATDDTALPIVGVS